MFQRWQKLSITTKFSSTFGLLLTLILLVAITSYIALTVVYRETEKAILSGQEIQGLILKMDRGLQEARVLQRDFFWRYPSIGFSEARQTYAQEAVQKMSNVVTLSTELKQHITESDINAALQEHNVNLNLYLSAAERYADTFLESVELVTQLAAPEVGLEAQLTQNSVLLQNVLQTDDQTVLTLYQTMKTFEKDYFITHQRSVMQSAINTAFRLRQAIENTPTLNADLKTEALTYLNNYRSIAVGIVNLNQDIDSKLNDFDLQAKTVDPISLELITLAENEVEHAQLRIKQVNQYATITLIIIALGGLVLVVLVARLLNNSVTLNIIKLSEIATKWETGDSDVFTQIDSADEIGVLADSFNAMATRINTLVNNLEQKVRERTARLETVANLSGRLNAILDFKQLLQTLVDQLKKRFNYYHVHIYLLDDKQKKLIMQAGVNEIGHQMKAEDYQIALTAEDNLVVQAVLSGKIMRIANKQKPNNQPNTTPLPDSYTEIAVPIIWEDKVVGVLNVEDKDDAGLDEGDANLLRSLASHVAVALINARLFEQTQQRAIELAESKKIAEKAKEEAEIAKEKAELANKSKSEFLSSMSHELRTPLNGILGYAQILNHKDDLDTMVKDGLNIIKESGEHLLTLITDILDLSKIEAGKLELNPTSVYFPSFLEGVVGMSRMRTLQKNLMFNYDVPSKDELTGVEVDEKRLRQILLNLLSNAIKFTDEGMVTFKVSKIANPTIKEYVLVRFEISDTGVGILPEQLGKIFNPFEQVGDARKQAEGTGLGLAISCQLVEAMGGKLQVESTFGEGSCFWFEIPLLTVKTKPTLRQTSTDVIKGYHGQKQTVLIVDDKGYNRSVLVNMLEPLGFEFILAEDGQQAIEKVKQFNPDVVFMDMIMPVMTGFEAVQQIRQMSDIKQMVIIGASASVFEEDRKRVQLAGCDDFLPKPVNRNDLLQLLEKHLALEWIYELPIEQASVSTQIEEEREKEIVNLPTQAELQALHELAMMGDLLAVEEQASELLQTEINYKPFVDALNELISKFDVDNVVVFIEQYLKQEDE